MRDASFFKMPQALRSVFASLLAFDEPASVDELWNSWKDELSDDFKHRGRTALDSEALAYYEIVDMFPAFSSLLPNRYLRPTPMNDSDVDHEVVGKEMYEKLNPRQKAAVDVVLAGQQQLIFIDGPGGTGKTFCYECIYHLLISRQKKVVCTAWSGIASNLLPDGRTVASLFKLNISQNCESSSIKANSVDGRFMKDVDIFIFDENSMISVQVIFRLISHSLISRY